MARKNNLFVLCYHSISSDNWFYSVKLNELKKQIEYLKKEGYQFITLDEMYNHVTGTKLIKSPSVAITIDDGYSNVIHALKFFEKENITPALFLISNSGKVNRKELDTNNKLLDSNEIKNIKQHGWTLGAHSATHSNLSKLSQEKLVSEITDSKKNLEKYTDSEIKYFAYPFGAYNKNVLKDVLNAGYKMALTMDDTVLKMGMNILKIPRIGVNNTHSITEFKMIFSPSVIEFRRIVKTFMH